MSLFRRPDSSWFPISYGCKRKSLDKDFWKANGFQGGYVNEKRIRTKWFMLYSNTM